MPSGRKTDGYTVSHFKLFKDIASIYRLVSELLALTYTFQFVFAFYSFIAANIDRCVFVVLMLMLTP